MRIVAVFILNHVFKVADKTFIFKKERKMPTENNLLYTLAEKNSLCDYFFDCILYFC